MAELYCLAAIFHTILVRHQLKYLPGWCLHISTVGAWWKLVVFEAKQSNLCNHLQGGNAKSPDKRYFCLSLYNKLPRKKACLPLLCEFT